MHSPGSKPAIFLTIDLDRFVLEITASTHCTDAKQYAFLTMNQRPERWKAAAGHVRGTNFVHGATEAPRVKFPRAHASKETYKLNQMVHPSCELLERDPSTMGRARPRQACHACVGCGTRNNYDSQLSPSFFLSLLQFPQRSTTVYVLIKSSFPTTLPVHAERRQQSRQLPL